MIIKKYLIALVTILALSGCASYSYDSVNYKSSAEALNAARADLQNNVNGIQPLKSPYPYLLRVLLPNKELLAKNGVIKTNSTPEESVQYIVNVLDASFRANIDAIKRRNIFEKVYIETKYITGEPLSGSEDFIIWLAMPQFNTAQWFIKNNKTSEVSMLHLDQSKTKTAKLISFLDGIEKTISNTTKSSRNKVQSSNTPVLSGAGSGFIVSETGYILTNAHVVDGCSKLTTTYNELNKTLTLIASDEENDLAILKTSITTSYAPSFSSESSPKLGESVVVAGFPLSNILSQQVQLTTGVLSATSGMRNDFRMFQFTAPVQKGNSGGPVINDKGEIIGIVSSKLNAGYMHNKTGDIPQNVNFAIKGAIAKIFMNAYDVDYTETNKKEHLSAQRIAETVNQYTLSIKCYQ